MTDNSYSVFNAMVDIVASPGKALDEIKQHTAWMWWPLLMTMALASGLMIYYYGWVDFEWLVEETIRQIPAEDRAESAGAIRAFMSQSTSTWTTVAALLIMPLIIYTITATYLHLANKLTSGAEIGFGQWFSLSIWSSFVGVFGVLASFIMIMMAGSNQLSTQDLQVTSMNALFFHAAAGEPWFTWASTLNLVNFWTIFLMSTGIARWTGASMVKSTMIAAMPWVLIFGIWASTI
ncbi:MAG: hypothetical protein GQ538_00410 [Xanthomonadales bacterium]|nr:hypothetical protein [Xanthomonadales bacterium]